jgi:hypothetical protein
VSGAVRYERWLQGDADGKTEMPPELLCMIVVHKIALIKEREHDKAFY